jgi:hypothetical protein
MLLSCGSLYSKYISWENKRCLHLIAREKYTGFQGLVMLRLERFWHHIRQRILVPIHALSRVVDAMLGDCFISASLAIRLVTEELRLSPYKRLLRRFVLTAR